MKKIVILATAVLLTVLLAGFTAFANEAEAEIEAGAAAIYVCPVLGEECPVWADGSGICPAWDDGTGAYGTCPGWSGANGVAMQNRGFGGQMPGRGMIGARGGCCRRAI